MKVDIVFNEQIWNRLPEEFTAPLLDALYGLKAIYWSREGERLKSVKKYDIPQSWWNASIKRAIVSTDLPDGYEVLDEVSPFPDEMEAMNAQRNYRLDNRVRGGSVDAFVEVEFGNAASFYRDVHKLMLCHAHHFDPILILIVPSKAIAKRCDGALIDGKKAIQILEELQGYMPGARPILIEVGEDEQGWFNLADVYGANEVKGNWIWDRSEADKDSAKDKQRCFDLVWDRINGHPLFPFDSLHLFPSEANLERKTGEWLEDALMGYVQCLGEDCNQYIPFEIGGTIGDSPGDALHCNACGFRARTNFEKTSWERDQHGNGQVLWVNLSVEGSDVILIGCDGGGWAFSEYCVTRGLMKRYDEVIS